MHWISIDFDIPIVCKGLYYAFIKFWMFAFEMNVWMWIACGECVICHVYVDQCCPPHVYHFPIVVHSVILLYFDLNSFYGNEPNTHKKLDIMFICENWRYGNETLCQKVDWLTSVCKRMCLIGKLYERICCAVERLFNMKQPKVPIQSQFTRT